MNTAGSFRCECKVGFEKLVPYEGCSDINECTGITIIKPMGCSLIEGNTSFNYL